MENELMENGCVRITAVIAMQHMIDVAIRDFTPEQRIEIINGLRYCLFCGETRVDCHGNCVRED